jgi:hypothetical protein
MISKLIFFLRDKGGRRSGIDRRKYCYSLHIPERRSDQDRRSGSERRSGRDRRKSTDIRISLERRTGIERRAALR